MAQSAHIQSADIRRLLDEQPSLTPREIQAELASQGVEVTRNLCKVVRHRELRKRAEPVEKLDQSESKVGLRRDERQPTGQIGAKRTRPFRLTGRDMKIWECMKAYADSLDDPRIETLTQKVSHEVPKDGVDRILLRYKLVRTQEIADPSTGKMTNQIMITPFYVIKMAMEVVYNNGKTIKSDPLLFAHFYASSEKVAMIDIGMDDEFADQGIPSLADRIKANDEAIAAINNEACLKSKSVDAVVSLTLDNIKEYRKYLSNGVLSRPDPSDSLQLLAETMESGAIVFDAANERMAIRSCDVAKEFSLQMILRGSGREYRDIDAIASCVSTVFPITQAARWPTDCHERTQCERSPCRLRKFWAWTIESVRSRSAKTQR